MTVRVDGEVEVDESLAEGLEVAVEAALRRGGREGLSVDVIVVSDETLVELHERFLGDDSKTDVMAFDLGEDQAEGPQGEIYVSLDRARARAGVRVVTEQRELALYAVHGALHLCGFDDQTEADRLRMRDLERSVLDELGYSPDDAPHELGA